jgi:hypothetical protein
MSLAFAGVFGVLLFSGYIVVGGTGLAMCLIEAFFDTFPLSPLSGKDILDYKRSVWAALFITTLTLYAIWLVAV